MSRGSALLEVLIIGALLALGITQAAMAAGRLHSAGGRATEAARVAASWSARHGDVRGAESIASAMAPDADRVRTLQRGDEITVVVKIDVPLLGGITRTVTGRATARISEYRSNRG
jgi:hypothetical protein